jgi:dihydrofolate reductase
VVLTSNTETFIDAIVSPSVEAVLERFRDEKEIVIIGGGEVYKSFAPYITKVYQTHIPHSHDNDIRMEVECHDWDLVYHDSRLGEDRPTFQIFEKMDSNDELEINIRKY